MNSLEANIYVESACLIDLPSDIITSSCGGKSWEPRPRSLTWLSGGNISIFIRAPGICLEEQRRRRKISSGTTNKSPLKRTRCVRKDLSKILSLEVELLRTPFLSQPPKPTLARRVPLHAFRFTVHRISNSIFLRGQRCKYGPRCIVSASLHGVCF